MKRAALQAENALLKKQHRELMAIIRGLTKKLGVEVDEITDEPSEEPRQRVVFNEQHRARVRANREAKVKRELGATQYL